MAEQKKHPDHIEPNWTKVMFRRLKWRFEIKTSQIATSKSKLRAFLNVFDGSSVPVGLLHCGGHMKPAQQCTKQLIIALVQSRGQIWTPWWFTIIWTNKLRTRFSNVHFTHFRLHACVRQLDSLEVALVIVSWWEPNCGGASKTSLGQKEITHFFYSPRRTTTCQNISGRSTKRVFFVTWPRENRPSDPSSIEFINLGADSCVPSKLKRL